MALWIKKQWLTLTASHTVLWVGWSFISISLICSFLFLFEAVSVTHKKTEWENFSPRIVKDLKKQGKPFFIDFTAQWCLSCKANKKFALETTSVAQAFQEKGVTLFRADWTRRDPDVSQAISEHGRVGVPLYILFTGEPKNETIILPEILTESLILEHLQKLKTPPIEE